METLLGQYYVLVAACLVGVVIPFLILLISKIFRIKSSEQKISTRITRVSYLGERRVNTGFYDGIGLSFVLVSYLVVIAPFIYLFSKNSSEIKGKLIFLYLLMWWALAFIYLLKKKVIEWNFDEKHRN